jgi:transposase
VRQTHGGNRIALNRTEFDGDSTCNGLEVEPMAPTKSVRRPYPPELRERAIRLVRETIAEEGASYGVVVRVAHQLGIAPETLRSWIRRSGPARPVETDEGQARRVAELERENRELRRANEILKAASTFFAAELDRHEPQ